MNLDFITEIKIFYVEDEPFIREGLERFLRRRTNNLHVFENGKAALDAFEELKPDLIITDIRMPVMDGLEMASRIRDLDENIPIIITTGHNDEDHLLRSIDIGIDKYIKKPVSFTVLMEVIKKITANIIHEKQMHEQRRFMLDVLDLNPNFVITTNGKVCTYINESFKQFLGCTDVAEYIEKYGNIMSVLVPKEDVFYAGKEPEEWIKETVDQGYYNRTVYMKPKYAAAEDETVCLMNAKPVPGKEEWLLSFTDVTALEQEKQVYRMLAQQDPLTKIYNRTKFFEEVDKELDRVIRYDHEMSIIMMDIDYFKEVNDKHGHLVGDKVLVELTEIVAKNIRKSDIFARYGGEEFALLMPVTGLEGAKDKAEIIRSAICNHKFDKVDTVTCSFGVATFKMGDTVDSFVNKADVALYSSKEGGRNTVTIFEEGDISCQT